MSGEFLAEGVAGPGHGGKTKRVTSVRQCQEQLDWRRAP